MLGREREAHTFDEDYFTRLAATHGHWWARGMSKITEALLDGECAAEDRDVLDAGVGTGANLDLARRIAGERRVCALDVAPMALVACSRRYQDVQLICASVTDIPLPDGSFDLVLCMDVLQHVARPDQATALAEMRRVMRPGGRLLLRTGAAFGHRGDIQRDDWRLYHPADLEHAIVAADLRLQRLTYTNSLPGLWATMVQSSRRTGRRDDADDHHEHPGGPGIPPQAPRWKNVVLEAVLALEAKWLARAGRRLPFGHSLYALASKPG